MKMKKAAVALCANNVDARRRGKSTKKHGKLYMLYLLFV